MELPKLSYQKDKKLLHQVFQSLETETKINNDKYDKKLGEIKYNLDILQKYALSQKKGQKSRNFSTLGERAKTYKPILFHNQIPDNSSHSLDKLINKSYINKSNKNESLSNINKKQIRADSNELSLNSNKISLVKNRNKKIFDKINKNSNEVFITNFDTNNNNNNNKLNNRYSQYIKNVNSLNSNNYRSSSIKKHLPPINRNLLSNNISLRNNNTTTINSLEDQYLYLNQLINDDNKINKTVDNNNINNNISYVETENSNGSKRKPKKIKLNENAILNFIKKNKIITNNIQKGKSELEDSNLDFETKFKYINWKYGISDINKYFIDIDAYKRTEEDEINDKKSFYDRLDDIIDNIKIAKKNKNIENIAKQFGVKLKMDENGNNKNKIDDSDKIFYKRREAYNSLIQIFRKQKDERKRRDKIEKILNNCKIDYGKIRLKLDSYRLKEKEIRLKEKEREEIFLKKNKK